MVKGTREVSRARGDENHKVAIKRTLKIEGSTGGGCQVHRELC